MLSDDSLLMFSLLFVVLDHMLNLDVPVLLQRFGPSNKLDLGDGLALSLSVDDSLIKTPGVSLTIPVNKTITSSDFSVFVALSVLAESNGHNARMASVHDSSSLMNDDSTPGVMNLDMYSSSTHDSDPMVTASRTSSTRFFKNWSTLGTSLSLNCALSDSVMTTTLMSMATSPRAVSSTASLSFPVVPSASLTFSALMRINSTNSLSSSCVSSFSPTVVSARGSPSPVVDHSSSLRLSCL